MHTVRVEGIQHTIYAPKVFINQLIDHLIYLEITVNMSNINNYSFWKSDIK